MFPDSRSCSQVSLNQLGCIAYSTTPAAQQDHPSESLQLLGRSDSFRPASRPLEGWGCLMGVLSVDTDHRTLFSSLAVCFPAPTTS